MSVILKHYKYFHNKINMKTLNKLFGKTGTFLLMSHDWGENDKNRNAFIAGEEEKSLSHEKSKFLVLV